MEKLKPTTKFAIVIVVFILLVGGYYMYNSIRSVPTVPDNTENIVSESEDKTQTIVISLDGNAEDGDGYTVEVIPVEKADSGIPVPDLERAIVFYVDFPEEIEILMRDKINTITATLKENPVLLSEWLSLGILWKQVGDFDAAIEVWDYASAIRPSNHISFLNLGDLYHFYLKDFPKAEENFRIAITNNPAYIQSYVMLHELYRYSYKQDTGLAVNVLNEALVADPNNVDILSSFAQYYIEKGDTYNVLKYYILARDAASAQGDIARAALFQKDIDSL